MKIFYDFSLKEENDVTLMNGWSLIGKESMKLSLRSKETWKIVLDELEKGGQTTYLFENFQDYKE